MSSRATQDEWVMVESSDKTWSTGEENGKPLQYSCLENLMDSMKRQKERTLKDELPRAGGAHLHDPDNHDGVIPHLGHSTREEWRNNTRKNEDMAPK